MKYLYAQAVQYVAAHPLVVLLNFLLVLTLPLALDTTLAQSFTNAQRPTLPCSVTVPMAPEDPATDRDYNCYFFGSYSWNDGSGAGTVRGRIYWP